MEYPQVTLDTVFLQGSQTNEENDSVDSMAGNSNLGRARAAKNDELHNGVTSRVR